MTESMNLDSSDIVGSLEGFESLEHIQAELDIFSAASNENAQDDHVEEMELLDPINQEQRSEHVKNEIIMEADMTDDCHDDEMTASHLGESISARIMRSNVNEIMHNVMDMDGHEAVMGDDETIDHEQIDDSQAERNDQLFSEGVINDKIIVDSQVMQEGARDVHHLLGGSSIPDEQVSIDNDVRYLDDIMNDGVNETVIEAAEVEDQTCEIEDTLGLQRSVLPSLIGSANKLITADSSAEATTGDQFLNRDVLKIHKIENVEDSPSLTVTSFGETISTPPPLTLVSKSDLQVQEAIKSITTGVYVVNNTSVPTTIPQSFVHSGGTLLTSKDAKIPRVVTIPSLEGAGQTIRIVAPPGKFNSTAKAITLSQARQMGLKISNVIPANAKTLGTQQIGISKLVVPSSKKTVTVVKSPTKILPGPPPIPQRPQKVLIRQANSLKTGTLLASGSSTATSTHMIRIPTSQTIQQILPSGSKQVQYVKLISAGGAKTPTLVPVSLSKTIPVLTTNILNSPTTFKVLPVSTQTRTTPTAQRLLIPATSASTSTSSQVPSSPQIVVLPSHLLQQVKKGDCKLTTVSSASIQGIKPTATINGNRKIAPALPPLKLKEPVQIGTPVVVPSSANVAQVTLTQSPAPLASSLEKLTIPSPTQMESSSSPDPPKPLVVTSFAEENPETSSHDQGNKVSPPSSPTANSNAISLKIEQKTSDPRQQEQWSGDEGYFEANGIRPRKPCNCTKSMCLKLYCDCFANGEFCYQCNCVACSNNLAHEEERQHAIKSCLERNPTAFRPKIGKTLAGSEERRHNRGCHCKRSGCLKNYCECYEAKIPCSKNCKCAGCKNTDAFFDKRSDDDRSRTDKIFDSSGQAYSSACRHAFSMLTPEVIQATCQCLIARAEKLESSEESNNREEASRLIIEEFGHCLVQIIDSLTKAIPQQAPS